MDALKCIKGKQGIERYKMRMMGISVRGRHMGYQGMRLQRYGELRTIVYSQVSYFYNGWSVYL